MRTQQHIIAQLAQLARTHNALVVSEIGSQTQWLFAAGDDERHLYLSGPMGQSPSVALGVALAQRQRAVLCIVGDGALAMNMGALATINHINPPNLTLALMNNGIYALTGGLPTPTQHLDWATIAAGLSNCAGYANITAEMPTSLSVTDGFMFWEAVLTSDTAKPPAFPLHPAQIHQRFRQFLQK